MYTEVSYVCYLVVSVLLTIWVARTLHRNGRVFLVEAFRGNEALADSVNHLLVVGFYLVNIGYVTLALKYGDKPTSLTTAIEFFSTKIGLVLVVLGVMHFFNMYIFNRLRRGSRRDDGPQPPHRRTWPPHAPQTDPPLDAIPLDGNDPAPPSPGPLQRAKERARDQMRPPAEEDGGSGPRGGLRTGRRE